MHPYETYSIVRSHGDKLCDECGDRKAKFLRVSEHYSYELKQRGVPFYTYLCEECLQSQFEEAEKELKCLKSFVECAAPHLHRGIS